METTPSRTAAAAERYLLNSDNRGIFERARDFSERVGSADLAAGVDYIAGGRFAEEARAELQPLAAVYRSYAGRPIERVLDAGCGPGVTTLALADSFAPAEVVGLDIEDAALALAETLASGDDRCSFRCAPLESFTDPDGFDLVQCRSVLEHVYDPRRALLNILRLLRPGGIAYVETPNYLFPWEPHVRVPMLPKSPKRLLAFECRRLGRDAAFIEHLNFSCDPVTIARWARAGEPSVEQFDLMKAKVTAIFDDQSELPRVASRARLVRALRASALATRAARGLMTTLPIAPSVMFLFRKPAAR
jgi:SAM-dependent methyltransferase